MKSRLLLILLCLVFLSEAQNIVPNWSFETNTSCPNSWAQLPNAIPWTAPTSNSADYFHLCGSGNYSVPYAGASFQYPKNGNAFAAIYMIMNIGTDYREYLEANLISPMINGGCYYGEFYVNLHDKVQYACNNIAASFSKVPNTTTGTGFGPLNMPSHIMNYGNPIINDTLNWVKVSGIYTASGGENYITIGNFVNDTGSNIYFTSATFPAAYYHVDAVSVFTINPFGSLPWAYNDTIVNSGDSVFIGNAIGGTFTSNWYTLPGVFIQSGAGIYVKPTTTCDYVVQYTICGVPRSDTLRVNVNVVSDVNTLSKKNHFIISPNPGNGIFTLELADGVIPEDLEIKIKNILGAEIRSLRLHNKQHEIDLEENESGIYYLELRKKGELLSTGKIIKI